MKLPGLLTVSNLPSALKALDTIVEQGEGAPHGRHDSHFARFCAIRDEWDELLEDNPAFEPASPAAHDPVMRRPLDPETRVWVTNPEAVRHLDLANAIYGYLLVLLTHCYGPAEVQHRRAYAAVAMSLMQALAVLGRTLARLPANPDHPGVKAGLSFSVPRNLGFRSAQIVATTLERLEELRSAYELIYGSAQSSPFMRAKEALIQSTKAQ